MRAMIASGLVGCLIRCGSAAVASCPAGVGSTPVPLPPALAERFVRAFALKVPTSIAERNGVVRCAGGQVLGCFIGANLPCGPADPRPQLPAADEWCRTNPNAAFVPAYISGHASLYAWRCRDGRPEIARQVAHADADGYVAEFWKPIP